MYDSYRKIIHDFDDLDIDCYFVIWKISSIFGKFEQFG